MYGLQANGLFQALGAGAGAGASASLGTTLAFANFNLPASGSGPAAGLSSFLHVMLMSGLLSLSLVCFVIAIRLIVRHRAG